MTRYPRPALRLLYLLAIAPACVVTHGDDDDDDGADSSASADDTNPQSGDGSTATQPGGAADGNGGSEAAPRAGTWRYEESAGATNDCSFIAQPSNGFGMFEITTTGAGTFEITPGDTTAPFVCTAGGGSFACDERLTGTIDEVPGYDVVGNILVSVEGTVISSTSIAGQQLGHIDCVGSDCAAASAALGVAFPCEFTVPFTGVAS